MAGYLNQNGNSIGSLLRFIQEQKSQSPMVPPSTETGSPIRAVTQEPLKGPEAQDTSRVVSIKPEAVISPSGQTQSAVAPGIESMGPIAPVGPVAAPIVPTVMGEKRSAVASPQPYVQPSQSSQPSLPSQSAGATISKQTSSAKNNVNPPSIGTKIGVSAPQVTGVSKAPPKTYNQQPAWVKSSTLNQPVFGGNPQTTPTPAPKQNTAPSGGWLDSIQRAIFDKFTKPFGGRWFA